jgi:hypothetical protein
MAEQRIESQQIYLGTLDAVTSVFQTLHGTGELERIISNCINPPAAAAHTALAERALAAMVEYYDSHAPYGERVAQLTELADTIAADAKEATDGR